MHNPLATHFTPRLAQLPMTDTLAVNDRHAAVAQVCGKFGRYATLCASHTNQALEGPWVRHKNNTMTYTLSRPIHGCSCAAGTARTVLPCVCLHLQTQMHRHGAVSTASTKLSANSVQNSSMCCHTN